VSGRKRHFLVDTLGLLLKVVVHPANISDRDGGRLVLVGLAERFPRLAHLWADTAYQGPFAWWVTATLGWTVTIVRKRRRWVWVAEGQEPPPYPVGFQVLPRRWVVERTIGWVSRYRRLSKDYEALPEVEEAWVHVALIGVMVRRLSRSYAS
jgi:putative transposase